jgi:hypothetical protein
MRSSFESNMHQELVMPRGDKSSTPTSRSARPNISTKATSTGAFPRRKPSGAPGRPSTRKPAAATRAAPAAVSPIPTCPPSAAAPPPPAVRPRRDRARRRRPPRLASSRRPRDQASARRLRRNSLIAAAHRHLQRARCLVLLCHNQLNLLIPRTCASKASRRTRPGIGAEASRFCRHTKHHPETALTRLLIHEDYRRSKTG